MYSDLIMYILTKNSREFSWNVIVDDINDLFGEIGSFELVESSEYIVH
jgi:hypothetical protein